MNFEDERYVRVYTRKTVTTKLLGWEGRACLHALLLEVDRAGVLDLEGMDPAEALTALADIPIEVTRVGMPRVIERGVAVVENGRLHLPRFMEAQEARQSDAQRQRESRARRAAELRSSEGAARSMAQPVTNCDHMKSQNVTDCHDQSHEVTSGHSVLSSAVLSTKQPSVVSAPDKPATPKPKRRWTKVPADWQPKQEHHTLAAELGVSLGSELPKFRDHEYHKPKSDPDACFRTWLRNAAEMAASRPVRTAPPGYQQHQQHLAEERKRPELSLFKPKPVPNPVSARELEEFMKS